MVNQVKTKIDMWAKDIPRVNRVFMVISLVFVFGLDLLILISNPGLAPFWFMMLGVLAAFVFFYYLENFVFRKRFAGTTSHLDKWILRVIILRNIIFVLNFIPFIQLIGLYLLTGFISMIMSMALFSGNVFYLGFGIFGLLAPVLLVSYIILIANRYSAINKSI
jgi:hypothetical protein